MKGSPVRGGTARDLLVVLALAAWVTTTAIGAMIAIATGAVVMPTVLVAGGAVGVGIILPRALRRYGARERRLLHARVGDPSALGGIWRRHLAAAWLARDEYAGVAGDLGDSPLADHVSGHQPTIDAALERCGALARDGDRLSRQLRRFRSDRLLRDQRIAHRRDPDGQRAAGLAARREEVDGLRRSVEDLRSDLEAQVHDLRTAVWRATELRTAVTREQDTALQDLAGDLARLRAALDEVDTPPHRLSRVDVAHDVTTRGASVPRARYDT